MFSWGEECRRGFRLSDGSYESGSAHLDLDFTITDLSAGPTTVCFVKKNQKAFIISSSEDSKGRRVRGKQKCVETKEKIRAVSCSDQVVLLLSKRGHVLSVDTTRPASTPRPITAFSRTPVSQVACGSQHSVALTKDGQVYTWGVDSRGQLGLGKKTPVVHSPEQVRGLCSVPVVEITAGGEQSFGLSVSGSVFSWGRNHRGQLGLGDTEDRHTPTHVHSLDMKKTVHVSCGEDHTAVLTKDGAVFTFGSGQHGQLGHNSFRDELRPRLVAEFWGSKVTQVACGRHHTLALTESKKIYSFGCGEQGQLGRGKKNHRAVPLPVQLPPGHVDGSNIRNIFAGGNCSFATCSSEDDNEESNSATVTQLTVDDMVNKWTSECDSNSWKNTKHEIQRTFSSASTVNKSFLDRSRDKHFQTSSKFCGLDFTAVQRAFTKLLQKDQVLTQVEATIIHLLPTLNPAPVGVEGLRIYLLLNELLHVVQEHKQSSKLAEAVAAAVHRLSADSLRVLGDWWSSLSDSIRVRHVEVWKKALSVLMSPETFRPDSAVKNMLQVLQYMYNANNRTVDAQRIPESVFQLSISGEVIAMYIYPGRLRFLEPPVIFSFPFLMNLQTKKKVLDITFTAIKKERIPLPCQLQIMANGWDGELPADVKLVLKLRRTSVLDDTFKQLANTYDNDFKKQLLVYYNENLKFSGVNNQDFFHQVFHEMMSPESGMFMFNDSKTLAWFPSRPTQEHRRYFLFGVLCGMALYNQSIIHLPFPLALFKKLLDVKPSLDDLTEFSPSVGQCLKSILEEYSEEAIESLDIDFLINWDGTDVNLDPSTPQKPVTDQNKKEFVDAYINYAFKASVERVFCEFKRGFFQVCDPAVVKLFQPDQLQRVLVGTEVNDWTKLKQSTVYKGQYSTNHPTILMFWEVFDELTEDQKTALLRFVTGFERVPILNTDNLKMTVGELSDKVQNLDYDQYYPKSFTCYSALELPRYSTKEIMKTKLIEAFSQIDH
ncbi:probable E3 ubiquitin-protein ligase HERC3 [Sphaeramia orbicularis]|uniref:Probable E3 ubiquitin-protein ligase HERC3 n=1 Tax=Sphaeramia orbicularis TaxID=375764 RepID=A0A672YRK6_9TELE|nr:probable E3 ubiquitin-protein ligase HERC3 [Sphaeramia orbicularis]